jgi:hypothetical protein
MDTVVCFGQDYTESGILERGTRSSLVEILSHRWRFALPNFDQLRSPELRRAVRASTVRSLCYLSRSQLRADIQLDRLYPYLSRHHAAGCTINE